jgi:Tfp pilus assembly protein PilE
MEGILMIKNKLKSIKGVTVLELVIAAFITGVIAIAAFNFYARMHIQSEVQSDLSDIQLICRNSMDEMKKMARMAGFKVGSHNAYEISNDTLSLYMRGSQPVDTIRYYLSSMPSPGGGGMDINTRSTFHLMKKINSGTAEIFADYITQLSYSTPNTSTLVISISAETAHKDLDYNQNGGYHTYSLTDRVYLRNVN